jgi:hypothetical protein
MKSLKLFATTLVTLISIFAMSSALATSSTAEIRGEDVFRAAKENNARLIQTIRQLKENTKVTIFEQSLSGTTSPRRHCNDDDDRQSCVRKCNSRYSNGSCASYDSDYCGPNASCVENCVSRYSNGTCASYDADYCGDNVSCMENCTSRYSNGTCASYGPDSCY